LEESEYFQDTIFDPEKRGYGSGNFRRAKKYWKPRLLVKAVVKPISPEKVNRVKWIKTPPPDLCQQSMLIHRECDVFINDPYTKEYRWSFNLEDGNCYLYRDPCPLFKTNSFQNVSQCIATCWRPAFKRK